MIKDKNSKHGCGRIFTYFFRRKQENLMSEWLWEVKEREEPGCCMYFGILRSGRRYCLTHCLTYTQEEALQRVYVNTHL
jgi:hypothetical protein